MVQRLHDERRYFGCIMGKADAGLEYVMICCTYARNESGMYLESKTFHGIGVPQLERLN